MKSSIAIILLLISTVGYAQNNEEQKKDNLRNRLIFLSFGSGFPELINTRIGYQISEIWSVSGKVSIYYDDTGGIMNYGIRILGLKITKYFGNSNSLFNNISLDAGYQNIAGDTSTAFDFSIGNESIYKSKFYWAVGFSWVRQENSKHYFLPGIKVGYNINF